jgi:protease-4
MEPTPNPSESTHSMKPFRISGALALAGSLVLLTPATAQAPNSSAPNSSAPNSSAPNSSAPNSSAPNSSAPKAEAAVETPPVLLIRPSGLFLDLPEQGGDLTSLLTGGGAKPKDFYEMLARLEETVDSESEHLLLDLSGEFQLNAPQLAEVDRVLRAIRKSGKRTWAYLEGASTGSYQLAAACDHVMMADLGVLELGSPAMSVTFMKDALDLLGVHMDVVRCGDFKGAVEPYLLSRMSDHLRAHYLAMLERINHEAVERIARGRNMSAAEVRSAQALRLFTARAALEAGFVDRLVPWAGAKAALASATGREDLKFVDALDKKEERRSVNVMQMLGQLFNPKQEKEVDEETLVVLHLAGGIVDGTKAQAGSIVSGPTVEVIERLAANDKVKGVVVRVNSPGGSATASEAILLALRDLAAAKPVVFSMGTLAASGGYYVTCIGRPILAEESTITGSIGVFGMKPSLGALLRRVGLHDELVALDASSSMASMSEPWAEEQKARVQAFVNQIYDVFVGHVARSRGKTSSEVLALAGGRVWSGGQAVENGLVDRIGGLHDALAMVAEQAGISGDYEVTHLPRPKSFLESLFADGMVEAQSLFDDPRLRLVAQRTNLDRALRVVLDALTSEQPTKVWAMMPEVVTFR